MIFVNLTYKINMVNLSLSLASVITFPRCRRKLNSLALSKHTQLLEVLEIPQVMETCVRNNYYEEALDLSVHVRRMSKKHGDVPIIKVRLH